MIIICTRLKWRNKIRHKIGGEILQTSYDTQILYKSYRQFAATVGGKKIKNTDKKTRTQETYKTMFIQKRQLVKLCEIMCTYKRKSGSKSITL